jgi:hypothetical protein
LRPVLPAALIVVLGLVPAGSSAPAVTASAVPAADAVTALVNASAPTDDLLASQFCAGVLVADNLVLTAAHCVRARRSGSTDVVVGADNLCRGAPVQGERLHADRVILHPRARNGRIVDAALLVLDGRAHAAPATPASRDASSPATGTEFGWGRNGYAGISPCRRTAVPLRFVAADRCAQAQRDLGIIPNPAWQSCAVPGAGASRNTCSGEDRGLQFNVSVRGRTLTHHKHGPLPGDSGSGPFAVSQRVTSPRGPRRSWWR